MPKNSGAGEHVVVVGSSAGGIEALSVLVGSLKPNFGAPIVLAQHLDPNRESYLPAILERKTSLPVVVVESQVSLEKGKIYVVPSNRHVMLKDGTVHVERDHGNRPRPSVDLLLSSAAESYGDRVIAVILTGSGSDGAAGAVAVKSAGGVVIIQNPETAAYPFMPQALPPTAVDHVMELDRIGPLLDDIVAGEQLPETIIAEAPDALTEILQVIGTHSDIDFRPYKPATVLRRIGRRMAVNHIATLSEYRAFLANHPPEVAELVRSLLIKVTEFFRDPDAFAYLRRDILPTIIERARPNDRIIRMWSAGCATGEEAYSLALLTADALGTELPKWSVKVFATDLDENAINFARRGLYPANVLNHLPESYRERFFEPADNGLRVVKGLRQMVIFGQQDISRSVPFPRIDLVACRNLLIYFKPELQQEVLDRFAYSLHATRGFLFLGKAETARPSRAAFQLVNKKWKVFQCMSGPFAAPPGQVLDAQPGHTPKRLPVKRRGPSAIERLETEVSGVDLGDFRRLNEVVLRNLPIGLAVIDRRYRIASINGAARRMLGIRDISSEHDFLHAARGLPYGEVRAAIDRMFRERATVTLPEVPLDSAFSDSRYLSLLVSPIQVGGEYEHATVAITDVTEIVETKRQLISVETEQKSLIDDISAANKRLVEVNKELQDANEELQAGNEEMMLTQEELQSTNEEFEATNEELQATNEELETNNEELQATNEELETTNDELTARTGELQEMARTLASERARFVSIVELAPFYIVVLRGRELLVETFNRQAHTLFTESNPAGQSFEHVAIRSLDPIIPGIRDAYSKDAMWSGVRIPTKLNWQGDTPADRIFAFTCVPVHSTEEAVDGVVLYGEDVTQQESQEVEERREKLRLIVEHAAQTGLALYDAHSRRLLFASPLFLSVAARLVGTQRGVSAEPPDTDAAASRVSDRHVFKQRWHELEFGAQREAMIGAFDDAVKTGRPIRVREIHLGGDEADSVWDCSLIPIGYARDVATDGVRYVCVSCVEVTEPVREREVMARLDRMKNEFLSMASHELRTPLMPLTAYADVLRRMVDTSEEKELVEKLQHQLRYMARLTDDLLDVARLETGKFRLERGAVDLREVVSEAAEQARHMSAKPQIRVSLPTGSTPLTAQGDAGRLLQAVFNLISNAMTHAPESDVVDVKLSHQDGQQPGKGVIEVTDYGRGVPDEERTHIFDRFFQGSDRQTSRKGLGLGLYICRSIVEQHGGTIEIQPIQPHGTTFRVRIPLSAASD